jgi:hypothetical protein
VGTVAALGAAVTHTFATLHAANQWRTVTVSGTSMPENFSGYVAGLHTIARAEWNLWQGLAAAALPYRIDYGDYATVATVPAPAGIAWGYPINVKYTLNTDFLICRGVGTTGYGGVDMDRQLLGHAGRIVAYPTRGRIATCWADQKIEDIVSGRDSPGNLESWVQISVSRHIELVRSRLP